MQGKFQGGQRVFTYCLLPIYMCSVHSRVTLFSKQQLTNNIAVVSKFFDEFCFVLRGAVFWYLGVYLRNANAIRISRIVKYYSTFDIVCVCMCTE